MNIRLPFRNIMAVDLFAGGGGASEGIEAAIGNHVAIAVNHDEHAIAMHQENHVHTWHYCESVYDVDPVEATKGAHVHLLWGSPDCKHFSRAKGGKPVSKQIRGLAWVICDWAEAVQPDVIVTENVMEQEDWGPLYRDDHPNPKLRNRPIPERKGETFREWVARLEGLAYVVEWRRLKACDYGAPTTRERLFVIARRDGRPIVWPEPTHGPGRAKPYRTAAECIDWSVPACSIFATPDQAKQWADEHGKHRPRRPLAPKTMARIAEGIRRYVLEAAEPFVFSLDHQSSGNTSRGTDEPVSTVTSKARHCVVSPHLTKFYGSSTGDDLRNPSPTVTGRQHLGVVTSHLLNLTHGGRCEDLAEPMKTVTAAHRGEKAIVNACLMPYIMHHRGQSVGRRVDEPTPTITATGQGKLALMSPYLINTRNGERKGQTPRTRDLERPLGTVTAQGSQGALVAAWMVKHYGGVIGHDMSRPLGTVTAKDHHSLGCVELSPVEHGRARQVAAFLTSYYGVGVGQDMRDPMRTVTTRDRFGLITVELDGETWVITDITMRMLIPRELARAQGFPDDYILTGTKTQQVARIGNSVCPPIAEAIVRANVGGEA